MIVSDYVRPGHFEVIAHRGGSLEAPENTLHAFDNAQTLLKDIIFELDVHATKDNHVVVLHDATVDRTTNGTGKIADLEYQAVKDLDAGFSFSKDGGDSFPLRNQGIYVPLLDEVLEKYPNRITIEVKKPGYEKQIVDIVDKYRARRRVILSSFDDRVVTQLRKLAPDMCSGFSRKEIAFSVFLSQIHLFPFFPFKGQVLQIPVKWEKTQVLTNKLIKNANRRGTQVHIWTINDEPTMTNLIEQGVDGIITDNPSKLIQVAKRFKKI